MRPMLAALLTLSSVGVVLAEPRTFVDDLGVEHTTSKTYPTLVITFFDGMSLVDMHVSPTQIIATYGERTTSGSNKDKSYYDGNVNKDAGFGNHNSSYDPSLFPVDPTPAEVAALAPAVDLSPTCSRKSYWCPTIDLDILVSTTGYPDFLVIGAYDNGYIGYPDTTEVKNNFTANGVPIITIQRIGGYIEVAERYEALAHFLGVAAIDKQLELEKQHLCSSLASFKAATKAAHDRGLRVLAGYLPYLMPHKDGSVNGFLYSPTNGDTVLKMFEENGLPLIHLGAGNDAEYHTGDAYLNASNLASKTGVPYAADFWLYDVRVTLDFTSQEFAKQWPHVAVIAKQYAYWPNGGHVYSYQHATEILTLVGTALKTAMPKHPKTACTEPEGGATNTDALGYGEFACYNTVSHPFCSGVDDFHDRVPSWQDIAAAAGWKPCPTSVALARKRRLAALEGPSSSRSIKEERARPSPPAQGLAAD